MAEGDAADRAGAKRPAADMIGDWVSLWQSEFAALASDREAQEQWQRMARLWMASMGQIGMGQTDAPPEAMPGVPPQMAAFMPPGLLGNMSHDGARTAASAWTAAFAHAFNRRDAELDKLTARIGELERRIAELERGS